MISADDVYNIFTSFVSPDSQQAADTILPLCVYCLEKLMKKLKSGADKGDMRIAYAAACDAYYSYVLMQTTDTEKNADFKAGDVTVKRRLSEALKAAEKIREDGISCVRELLNDESFGVWSV